MAKTLTDTPRLSDEALRKKIESNVKVSEGGCWEWQKSCGSHGYGNIATGGQRNETAHRVSYEVFVGPIPEGLLVLHSCNNRKCCNPQHLRVGDTRDNIKDAKEAGTWKGYPRRFGNEWRHAC